MSEITLSAGVRANLLALQNTASLMEKTQTRLATGKRVNSALDNPTSFFTAQSLHARSNDLSSLLDSMSNGIKTIEAADNGLKAITKTIETMQSTARQARQDNSWQASQSYEFATPSDGDLGINGVDIALLDTMDIDAVIAEINNHTGDTGVTASKDGTTNIVLTSSDDFEITTANAGITTGEVERESDVRNALSNQFNDLKDQLRTLAEDAGFNGINLLAGDELKLVFNETGTSTISVMGRDAAGEKFGAIDADSLGIKGDYDFNDSSNASLDDLLADLGQALTTVRTQASAYGANLSSVQNRQEFTKSMMNTLQTGADALVLADTNEEGANMLALQTRQQLSSVALSLASQADQNVLRLF